MKTYDYDIVIVGAGPAGANLARLLNSKTYKILLLDGGCGREKVCGGLLSPDAQDVLARYDICLPKEILASPQLFSVRTVDLSDGLTRYYRRSYMNIDRQRFDAFLLSMVPDAVTVLCEKCRGVKRENGGFSVALTDKSISCRYVVGADGASSVVRRALFPEKKIERFTAIQQWFASDEENANYSCVFDSETSKGCSWIFYKDGRLVFGGAFAFHESRKMFEKQKEKLISLGIVPKNAFDAPLRTEACLVCRPKWTHGVFFGGDGAFLIGEAAGLISPSSFEGISYALESGEALALSLGQKSEEKILRDYRAQAGRLKRKVLLRCLKRPFMYQKTLRRAVMKSGLTALHVMGKESWSDGR